MLSVNALSTADFNAPLIDKRMLNWRLRYSHDESTAPCQIGPQRPANLCPIS